MIPSVSETSTGNVSNPSTPMRQKPSASAAAAGTTPHRQLDPVSQACDIAKASLAVSILLILKKYLKVSRKLKLFETLELFWILP